MDQGNAGAEEYDDLRDVGVLSEDPSIWTSSTGSTPSPVTNISSPSSIIRTSMKKTLYGSSLVDPVISTPNLRLNSQIVTVSQTQTMTSSPSLTSVLKPAKKRKAARPSSYSGSKSSKASDLSFTCDKCNETFFDPQAAVKHISEKHMTAQRTSSHEDLESQVLVSTVCSISWFDHFLTSFKIQRYKESKSFNCRIS